MRILFCTLDYPPSPAGGAERQAQLQAEALVHMGHYVDVVCPRTGHWRSAMQNGVRVHRLPRIGRGVSGMVSYLVCLWAFLILRVRSFDLVHVHLANLQADVAVAVAHLLRRPSYVKLAAGGPMGEIGRMRRLSVLTRNYGIRHADLVQAISEEIESDVLAIGVRPERIRAIPNGVRIPSHPPTDVERETVRRHLHLPRECFVALYVGRMERDKGVADLLEAWDGMDPSRHLLVLLGSLGVKHPVPMSGLPPGAIHRPWSENVDQYLVAADVLVLPSHTEGMSNALLEAMAQGVAAVATHVGAASRLLNSGESGLLVDAHDVAGLRHAIQYLADDDGARQRMGEAARRDIGRFSIESVAREIDAAYRSFPRHQ